MSSEAKIELATLLINANNVETVRQILVELGHPQPSTPIQTNNATERGIIAKILKQKKYQEMDTLFYWLQDRGWK